MAVFALNAQAERATWAEIDLDALRQNLRVLSSRVSVKIMAVVKANAYGHGASGIAAVLEESGVSYFGVAAPYEGALLRAAGVKKPIIILSPTRTEQSEIVVKNSLTPSVADAFAARAFLRSGTCCHIKVNTGMNRSGVAPEEALTLIQTITEEHGSDAIEGVFSHLYGADSIDRTAAYNQFEVFEAFLRTLRENNLRPPIAHIANSAAILDMPEMALDMVRPGIAMYGLYPSEYVSRSFPLAPVLSWHSTVVEVRRLKKGDQVSYGGAFTAAKDTTVALIPVGYADGYRRSLSNLGEVLINGKRCRVAGRVCMDLTAIDCRDNAVNCGDQVVLIGKQGDDEISADEMAGWLNTINYEVTTQITDRVPRKYIDSSRAVAR